MATSRLCPICDRQVPRLKNGLRTKHYINETEFFGYRLKVCEGADPEEGSRPSGATIEESKRRTGIRCRYCDQRVGETDRFLPKKHRDRDGKVCRGWADNQGT
ncbi:hypothetical protein F4561_002186 [Lipingzhangella halophila]|uniref:Uncharacterized protein n=1 Tax=Lipingzhangella halophila TaxID=1783352 RepID=A0A7W7W248_9ACTN|nr:hypothetical protein [Lipingzhangella halophila]MBB4931366.1 hypothetical protein [Lipingzhangella halophila]